MRRVVALACAALLLALAGCSGFATTGDVNPGRVDSGTGADPGVAFQPDGPQPDATPEQIVEGFVRAGSGPQGGWATARLFLADAAAEEWDPAASVTIDRLADRRTSVLDEDDEEAAVTMTVSATGSVDEVGGYAPQPPGSSSLAFSVERQDDDQWRITEAPDGIVLFEEEFRSVFQEARLSFFDPTWTYLVPDVRWFPRLTAATSVARGLLAGTATWLVGAVRTAFPDDVALASAAVTSAGGVAQVELDREALPLDATTLGRMQAQLEASMRSVNVPAVQMTVDGTPLVATPAPTTSTRVDTSALVSVDDGPLGFLEGGQVESLGALSDAIAEVDAAAVETNPARTAAAVLTAGGVVARADDEGVAALDERAGLLAPSIDPTSAIWSVPRGNPQEVRAFLATGQVVAIPNAWPEATAIDVMQISRDGTRVAAAVDVRGRLEIWVAGIRRSTDGVPLELGEPHLLALTSAEALDLAWVDEAAVDVLQVTETAEVRLREQPVGGPGTDLTVPVGVSSLAGGNSTPRLLADDGSLYTRQTASWQRVAENVTLLATQQGQP
jgi:hypothetical protein